MIPIAEKIRVGEERRWIERNLERDPIGEDSCEEQKKYILAN